VPNVVRNRVTLIAPHGWHHRVPAVKVYQLDDVLTDHRTSCDGLPVTTPPRTIVDLAAHVTPPRLLRIVEDASQARVASYTSVGECMTSIARRGKPGILKLARVLDTLTSTNAVSMSKLERLLFELLVAEGLPLPRAQFPFPGRLFTNGCVDAAYVDIKLVVEADGRSWHTRISELKRDHDRDADAARHGWQTLRLLHDHIVDDPAGTADLVRDVRRERLSLFSRQ
jgi:very-short-patch-repair endonuclease